jgi:formylglycine-generating enzyme required for sulfatase activity
MNASLKKSIETRSYKGLLYERYPTKKLLTWNEAVEYAQKLSNETKENWRLASIEELQKLFTKENRRYIKDLHHIWSGTEENFQTAWVMDYEQNFYYLREKNFKFRVLCVRDTILTRSIKYF